MEWVDSISCVDPKIYKASKLLIEKPINAITDLVAGGNLINFKECKKTE